MTEFHWNVGPSTYQTMARGVASHNTWKFVYSALPLWQNRRFHTTIPSRRWRLPFSQCIFTQGKHSDPIIILCSKALASTSNFFLTSCTGIQYKYNLWKLRLLLQNLLFFRQNTQTCPKVDSTYTRTVQIYRYPFFPQNKRNLNLNTWPQSETCSSRFIPQNHSKTHLLWHLKRCNTQLEFQLPYEAVGTPFVLHCSVARCTEYTSCRETILFRVQNNRCTRGEILDVPTTIKPDIFN